MSKSSKVTTDHDAIRRWAEERGGKPAAVKRTREPGEETGVLRIDVPGYSGGESPEPGTEGIAVENGEGVARALEALLPEQAQQRGGLARQRVLAEHTCAQRAEQVERCLLEDRCI